MNVCVRVVVWVCVYKYTFHVAYAIWICGCPKTRNDIDLNFVYTVQCTHTAGNWHIENGNVTILLHYRRFARIAHLSNYSILLTIEYDCKHGDSSIVSVSMMNEYTHTPHKPKVTQWTEKDANAISKKRRSRKKNSLENTRTENDLIQANRTQQQRQNGLDSTRLVIFILVVL